jgi:hypothetical protein
MFVDDIFSYTDTCTDLYDRMSQIRVLESFQYIYIYLSSTGTTTSNTTYLGPLSVCCEYLCDDVKIEKTSSDAVPNYSIVQAMRAS